ncbi:hypothetical protein Tco_0766143 [Tanacetum coccineum]
MPVELGSFDAIIGMDWLAKYQANIVAEKIGSHPVEKNDLECTNSSRLFRNTCNLIDWAPSRDERVILATEIVCPTKALIKTPVPPLRELRDDIPEIYSKEQEVHKEHLSKDLRIGLSRRDFCIQFSNGEFWIPKVQFLRIDVIDSEGIR